MKKLFIASAIVLAFCGCKDKKAENIKEKTEHVKQQELRNEEIKRSEKATKKKLKELDNFFE